MSDQHMNASDQGTQPDSGSAPNDQVNVNAAGGSPQGAPSSAGSQPDRTQGDIANKGRVPEDGDGEQGYEAPGGKDNINRIKG
jgi:hypothetical protein